MALLPRDPKVKDKIRDDAIQRILAWKAAGEPIEPDEGTIDLYLTIAARGEKVTLQKMRTQKRTSFVKSETYQKVMIVPSENPQLKKIGKDKIVPKELVRDLADAYQSDQSPT